MEEQFFDAVPDEIQSDKNNSLNRDESENDEDNFHDTFADFSDCSESDYPPDVSSVPSTSKMPSKQRDRNSSHETTDDDNLPNATEDENLSKNRRKMPEVPHKSVKESKAEALQKREEEEKLFDENELKKRFDEAQVKKSLGNEKYGAGEMDEAIELYSQALELCPLSHKKERAIMFSNRAACYIRQEARDKALEDCDDALLLHPTYMKCLLRRAEQRRAAEKLQDALEDYQKIVEMDPGNMAARMACMTLPDEIKAQQEKMKEEMFGQLKQLGNLVLKPFGLSTENFKMVQDPNSGGYSINFVK